MGARTNCVEPLSARNRIGVRELVRGLLDRGRMIVTLTANPAVDQTLWLDRLRVGEVNRPAEVQLDPAGKGVNVSRMARRLGWPTIAFGFLAGDIGQLVERALDEERVQHHFVPIAGQTRINVTINDASTATSFFAPGPAVDPTALAQLDEMLDFWLPACRVLVLAGSLLPGMPEDYYARLVRRAQAHALRVIVDADGEVARLAVEARPFLVKPNVSELERLAGSTLPDLASQAAAARELVRRGIEVVLLSMGAAGALCVSREAAWRVHAPRIERRSTVGSGDSLVAGMAVALARGDALEVGLRLGTAAGAATALSPGTALGTVEDIARLLPLVRIEPL
jgi:1-phosphofructokinase family hexose kinase